MPPLLWLIDTPEDFAADCQRGMDQGRYDRRDMPMVVASVRKWFSDEVRKRRC